MSDPFKLRVLKALTASLEQIAIDDDYQHDLAGAVFRGRMWFGESDALPLVSVLEGTAPGEDVAEPPMEAHSNEIDWPLLIQGFVRDDPDNPTDPAYLLLADVRRRLAVEKARRSGHDRNILGFPEHQIVSLSIGSGVVRPADDVSANAWFWLTLVLRVVDNPASPFA